MWKLPLLEARTSISGSSDTHIVGVFQDSGKKAVAPRTNSKPVYAELIEKLRKADVFDARLSSSHFVRFGDHESDENVLFLGLGSAAELTEEKLRSAGGQAWSKLIAEKAKNAVIWVDTFFEAKGIKPDLSHSQSLKAFAEGIILNAYQFKEHKSGGDTQLLLSRIAFLTREKSLKLQLDSELAQVQAMGEAVRVTRDWSNQPSNVGTPIYYANEAKRLSKAYGLKCRVLTEEDAKREKMGLYLGVGQGSVRESRFVIVEYSPKNAQSSKKGEKRNLKKDKDVKTVCLVGKGVTFDSGGISLKPGLRMEDMKHDMTGAATVMGAILLAASWKVSNRVTAIMAFVENMPDADAIQPGNILTARNGKTVEIINTDAEGRLVLADALDFAQDEKPDAIIDVATLTGAVSVALGKYCCAILGNDDELVAAVQRAGQVYGERLWQLPLYDEYFDDMKSDYADMKNSVNDGSGGAIRGAIFLKQFIRKGVQWAHLDIAGTAYNVTHSSYLPKKGASGSYVRTLARFAADF